MNTRRNERGSALLYALLIIMLLMGLASSASMLVVQNQKSSTDSQSRNDAFYLADSGAQIGNYLLRSNGGSLAATTLTESIGDGTVTVGIQPLNPNLYRIQSMGTASGTQESIEMHVEFPTYFKMEGALQINFSESVEVSATDVALELESSSVISGLNHDDTGALLADQSQATYGVALKTLPGEVAFDITMSSGSGADLIGMPLATTSTATGNAEIFNSLLAYSRSNADVSQSGDTTLGDSDTGSYGTPGTQLLTYVSLGDNESLTLDHTFMGYGTLVVEVDRATTECPVTFRDSAKWHGLVVVHFTGEADVSGKSLILLRDSSEIIGGLSVNFTGDNIDFASDGLIYEANSGSAALRYSSTLTQNAVGISQVLPGSARVVSYRRVLP